MYAYSPDCVALTKASESCRLTAYLDPAGFWTIGWGRKLLPRQGYPGLTCTQEEADTWLEHDLQTAWKAVQKLVKVPLTQGQVDALVDFTFNEGSGRLAGSSLLKCLNSSSYAVACGDLSSWVYARVNGVEVREPGLVKRRAAEQALWQKQ